MSGIGVNLRVTGHCSQGGRKYMEDMFSVAYQQTADLKALEYAFFGIYDGHGGPQAASYAKEHLLDSIVNQRNFWSNDDEDILRAIRDGYIATHYSMWKDLEKWPKTTSGLPSTSGSTATIAFIMRGKIYIGHVGDTAIVLGYQEDGVKEWKAKMLTRDHKPENNEEKHRIEQSGGKVVNKSGVPRVVWNRPRLGHQGPVRRSTLIDEIPFLAVARSLGDFWSYNAALDQFVVSPEPDVLVYPVDVMNFRCLVLGTDGLWNMMTPERAVAIVQATEMHNEKQVIYGLNNQYNKEWLNPSKTLVDRALDKWVTTNLRADNTSVVTLLLDPPGPPRAQVLLKQIKKWGGESAAAECETEVTVPKSGGLAIFTHYPYADGPQRGLKEKSTSDIESSSEKKEKSFKCVNKLARNDNEDFSKEHKENNSAEPFSSNKVGEVEPKNEDRESASRKHINNVPAQSRPDEKRCMEETSSDAENERVFLDCDLKKRRLSLDKKNNKAGTRRRPSLPVLSGNTSNLCKTRSLEESTRMLRSATPIKTLRSRNIDLSDLNAGSTGSVKRGRAASPLVGKKLRLEDQSNPVPGRRKSPNKLVDTDSTKSSFLKSFLEHENDAELFYNDDKREIQDVCIYTKKLLKERKHKSTTPSMLSKWKDTSEDCNLQSVSDSELQSMLTSFVPHNRRSRLQEDCSKRKLKVATPTSRSSSESLLESINDL